MNYTMPYYTDTICLRTVHSGSQDRHRQVIVCRLSINLSDESLLLVVLRMICYESCLYAIIAPARISN